MELHRTSVYGSAATVQLSVRCKHEENINMINNKHDEEMKKIESENEINKLNAISQNKIAEDK